MDLKWFFCRNDRATLFKNLSYETVARDEETFRLAAFLATMKCRMVCLLVRSRVSLFLLSHEVVISQVAVRDYVRLIIDYLSWTGIYLESTENAEAYVEQMRKNESI